MLHIECANVHCAKKIFVLNCMKIGQWPHVHCKISPVPFDLPFILVFICSFDHLRACFAFFHQKLTHIQCNQSHFLVPTFYPKLKQWNFDVFVTCRTFFIFHIMSHLIWIKTHIFCSCAILSCALVVSYNLYVCTMAVDVANRAHGFFRFYRHPPPKTNIRHSIFNIAHYTYSAHYILCILLSRLVSRVARFV